MDRVIWCHTTFFADPRAQVIELARVLYSRPAGLNPGLNPQLSYRCINLNTNKHVNKDHRSREVSRYAVY